MLREESSLDLPTHVVRIVFILLLASFLAFTLYGVGILRVSFTLAFLFSFFMNWAVNRLERMGLPRHYAALVVVLGVVLGVLLLASLVSLSLDEIKSIIARTEQYKLKATLLVQNMRETIRSIIPDSLREILPRIFSLENIDLGYISRQIFSLVQKSARNTIDLVPVILANLFTIFLHAFITIVLTFIFLQQGQQMYRGILSMVPNRYFEMVVLLLSVVKRQITSYLRGLFIQVGILSFIMSTGFYLVGLPFGPILGVLVAFANLVPYFGPMVGFLLILIVSLFTASWWPVGISALGIFLFAQLVDNSYIQLKILGGAVKLPPIIALISVFAFQELLGPIGLVIAIPMAGVLKVMIEVMYRNLKAFRVI